MKEAVSKHALHCWSTKAPPPPSPPGNEKRFWEMCFCPRRTHTLLSLLLHAAKGDK